MPTHSPYSWISARRTAFVLFDYMEWHSNNVPIRCVYCCVELYLSPAHNTLNIRNIFESIYVCVRVVCVIRWAREPKKMSITNFPFHSFGSFTLLISFILCTNKHIDGRTDGRTDCSLGNVNMVSIQNSLAIWLFFSSYSSYSSSFPCRVCVECFPILKNYVLFFCSFCSHMPFISFCTRELIHFL